MRKTLSFVVFIFILAISTTSHTSIAQNNLYEEVITLKNIVGAIWSPNSDKILMVMHDSSDASDFKSKPSLEMLDIDTGITTSIESLEPDWNWDLWGTFNEPSGKYLLQWNSTATYIAEIFDNHGYLIIWNADTQKVEHTIEQEYEALSFSPRW